MKLNPNELQKQLDAKKYVLSKKVGVDLSGQMQTCFGCKYRDVYFNTCYATQEQRESQKICAKTLIEYLGGKYDTRK